MKSEKKQLNFYSMKKTLIFLFIIISLINCKKKENTTTTSSNSSSTCTSTQCTAIASSTNQRCQNMTTNCVGLCYLHD